jgi:folate-binding protein YgfZ
MVDLTSTGAGPRALPRDTLRVVGPDRKTWLDGLLTCAVTAVAPGQAGYGLLLTKQGKIVTDAYLLDTGSELFVGVAPGRGPAVRELLDRYLVMEDAELDAAPPSFAWRLGTGAAQPDAKASGTLSLGAWQTELAVLDGAAPGLLDAADALAEHGFGVFGVDFGEHDNPHEASLDRVAVSWTKGCYLGQEVVCMQDMRGKVKRRLVALDTAADLLPQLRAASRPLEVLGPDGSSVGQVSSVHELAGGLRLLASISAPALESPGALTLLGQPVRVAVGSASKLS